MNSDDTGSGPVRGLVETDWLESHLDEPDLRVLDCTVIFHGLANTFRLESGAAEWSLGHIPGSCFADLLNDLSDSTAAVPLMMPSANQFAEAMGRYGVGPGTRVVLYDRSVNIWAARVWWMLRVFGFDEAAVLNGGWNKWLREGRRVSTDRVSYPHARFVARPRAGLIATKAEVLAATTDADTCIINALSAEEHAGSVARYGRPGHIPGSRNVPARSLMDATTNAYRPLPELQEQLGHSGALGAQRVITYCGGGIAASSDAFVLTLLGQENVAVYDGSMCEWAADPSTPLVTN